MIEIKLRFVPVSGTTAVLSALAPGIDQIKREMLSRMGIECDKDETPLNAWLREMHVLNGLEPSNPVNRDLSDAILNEPEALRFMWFLA